MPMRACDTRVFCVMATSDAGERVFTMAVHVMNGRRANLESWSVTDILFSAVLLKLRKKRSRLTKTLHIFTLQCLLRASTGFEMNH